MDNAHNPILALVLATLSNREGNILDIGCGNGALLKKLYEANPQTIPFGIEIEPSKIQHGQELLPQFVSNLVCGDVFEEDSIWADDRHYALAILMPGRIIEAEDAEKVAKLKERIEKQCENLLIYAYGDWLTRYENLAGLAQQAGIKFLASDIDAKVGMGKIQ
jgi:SAM-dependent methyltransferase